MHRLGCSLLPVSRMASQESGDAQQASPPVLISPGQDPQQFVQQEGAITPLLHDDALAQIHVYALAHDANADADADACRATRTSFPSQNGEQGSEAAKVSDSPASSDKQLKGAWKDEWVVSLIHLRGSIDDEFVKLHKSGVDLWTRVCTGMSEAHGDFDKTSESCRKKWQRLYKVFKDSKSLMASGAMEEKQMPSKWYDLIEHYMHHHFGPNGNPIGGDEPVQIEGVTDMVTSPDDDIIAHHIRVNAKRARKDQEIKETLSKMVVTWRESLQVLKQSEAERLEILQRMSSSMAGLLDTLKK